MVFTNVMMSQESFEQEFQNIINPQGPSDDNSQDQSQSSPNSNEL